MTRSTEEPESLTVLVIPDSHAGPGQDLYRFSLLGRAITHFMAKATNRCVVLNIGDMVDFASLSSFDRPGSKALENRRYLSDLEAGLEAQRLIWKEVEDYNRWRRGEKILELEWIYLIGNHEARVSRAIQSDPAHLDGVISLDDITRDQPIPWTVHPFNVPTFVGGVAFSHYFTTGVMGRAAGGENPAATILRKQMVSCVQGHTHTIDFAERTAAGGKKISALVCGYYGLDEEWAGAQTNALWTKGLALLHVKDGEYDLEWWSWRRLLDQFG